MRKVIINEDGKSIECDEADFFYLQQILEESIDILKPYGCVSATQYLELVQQLVHARKNEIFNNDTGTVSLMPRHPLNNLWGVPDIDFQDSRKSMSSKKD